MSECEACAWMREHYFPHAGETFAEASEDAHHEAMSAKDAALAALREENERLNHSVGAVAEYYERKSKYGGTDFCHSVAIQIRRALERTSQSSAESPFVAGPGPKMECLDITHDHTAPKAEDTSKSAREQADVGNRAPEPGARGPSVTRSSASKRADTPASEGREGA